MASREYLEEMLAEAKKFLPGWLYASLVQSARPRAGGRAAHRVDEPGVFEKLALAEIKPERLRDIDDDDLDAVWLRLHQWFGNAKRRQQPVENIVNAALWVKQERERRGKKVEAGDLVDEVAQLEATRKARRDAVKGVEGELPKFIKGRLAKVPDEILLVRDFVSVAGSAAVAEKPGDIDCVVRAEYDAREGTYGIDGRSLGVALRRFLSPDKRGPQVQLIDAPQGSFTDYVPVFDLVVRRREPHVVKIEETPPEYEGRERVVKNNTWGSEGTISGNPRMALKATIFKKNWYVKVLGAARKGGTTFEPFAGEGDSVCATREGRHIAIEKSPRAACKYKSKHGNASVYVGDNIEVVEQVNFGDVTLVDFDACGNPCPSFEKFCEVYSPQKPYVASFTWGFVGQQIHEGATRKGMWKRLDRVVEKACEKHRTSFRMLGKAIEPGRVVIRAAYSIGPRGCKHPEPFAVEKAESSVPAGYRDRDSVIKQARAASAEQRAQAERAKKADVLTPGEFFYQPKPTRPAKAEEAQTVERLVEFYTERSGEWLPSIVQRKFDGARHQVHKVGSTVRIFSEDGDDNTDRLPSLVEDVRKLSANKVVLDVEIEAWDGKKHLPREAVAGYLAGRDEPDDAHLRANAFDVLYWKGDIHNKSLRTRLEVLKQIKDGTVLKVVGGELAKTPDDIERLTEKLRKEPGSEGMVAKQIDSPYRLDHTTGDEWVKYHNATVFHAEVIKAKRTKGGVWVYTYGVRHNDELLTVGDTFSTGRALKPGDGVRIEAETVNKEIGPEGVRLTAWVPRVLGEHEGVADTVDAVVKRAAKDLVLRVKEVDDEGEIDYLPANVIKALRPEVPTVGPVGAKVGFVGASPGRVEAARREPMAGPGGVVFNEVYLKPLGLKRSEVMVTNAVPVLLEDEKGRTREPTVDEMAEWRGWLKAEIEKYKPEKVVALGRTAEAALAEVATVDLVLPHPSAVRRFGDSGEVGRKLRQLEQSVRKQAPGREKPPRDEGGTRAAAAYDHWEKNWIQAFPKDGKGTFVYQHHWRGLDEDETKMSDEQLMKDTEHSVHGDLRLSDGDGLWGWAVFLGRTQDNRGLEHLDKLIDWKKGDNIELAPKLEQPQEWLEVGVGEPYVSEPGEAGATSEKFSKFFALDRGTYQLGVARQHAIEIFLDGEKLKGRYLFLYAPVGGRRRWLIDKPEDQTPWAESRDLADVISELKKKRQRWLYWSKPGSRPEVYDVRTGKVVSKSVPIAKSDPLKRIVYGVVLDPYGAHGAEADAHNDWPAPDGVEESAHWYLKNSRVVGLQHKGKTSAEVVESWVEQYPSRDDYLKACRGEPHRVYRRKFGSDTIHSGSWLMGVRLNEELWKLFKAGKITAFSPGGFGTRRAMSRREMPTVTFIDLVEKPA